MRTMLGDSETGGHDRGKKVKKKLAGRSRKRRAEKGKALF